MNIRQYSLEFIVFVCGMVVMIYELVGSRVLAPYLGTSLFVWTSIIGVILGSLSLGYYLGGKLADRKADFKILSFIFFFAGLFVILGFYLKDPILILLHSSAINIKISSIIASLLLFFPTSVLLGMVSPYAVKLKLKHLKSTGSTVGNLFALSTIGSIVGTFLAGFYLIPNIGTNNLLISISGLLVVVSLISYRHHRALKFGALALITITFVTHGIAETNAEKAGHFSIDTVYSQVEIYPSTDSVTKKPIKEMSLNHEKSSAMFLDSDDLVYNYTKYYDLAKHFNPDFKKSLLIGGAGYSYPKHYLKVYPDATLDVVEIDPMVTELAREHFRLKDDPRLRIFHEDGRTFLNSTENKYDAILGDAFKSNYSIPYQLTTREAVQKKYTILNEDGVVLINIVSSFEGEKGSFLRAEYATYKSVFPQVYVLTVKSSKNPTARQAIILVALKSEREVNWNSSDPELDAMLRNRWVKTIESDKPILTDDYAPVDYYLNRAM